MPTLSQLPAYFTSIMLAKALRSDSSILIFNKKYSCAHTRTICATVERERPYDTKSSQFFDTRLQQIQTTGEHLILIHHSKQLFSHVNYIKWRSNGNPYASPHIAYFAKLAPLNFPAQIFEILALPPVLELH